MDEYVHRHNRILHIESVELTIIYDFHVWVSGCSCHVMKTLRQINMSFYSRFVPISNKHSQQAKTLTKLT